MPTDQTTTRAPASTAHTPDRSSTPARSPHAVATHHPPPHRTGRTRKDETRRNETGQTAIQVAILLPLVIFLIIGAIQGMLWFAGRQVAIAAASEGARVTATELGTAQSGQAAAVGFANTAGRGFLLAPHATVTRTDTIATVTLTGSTQVLVAGVDLTVTQTASLPVERLTAPTETGQP